MGRLEQIRRKMNLKRTEKLYSVEIDMLAYGSHCGTIKVEINATSRKNAKKAAEAGLALNMSYEAKAHQIK